MESSTTTTRGSSATKPPVRNLHIGEAQEDVLDRPFNLPLWLRLHGVDLLTMSGVAAVCLGVHFANPVPRQLFPIYNLDGSLVYPHLAYPRRTQIIPIWASAMIAILAPFLFISLFQWRRRSIDDALTTFMGVFKSVLTASVLQVIFKTLIGGLRPHFYSACQPNLELAAQALSQSTSSSILPMFDKSICTGDPRKINDALQTMPSGHTTAAWAGLFFLSLYFNAQLKVMAAHNPAYWKMLALFAPLLGASLLSGYLVTDGHHHTADVLVGAFIGICSAIVAFRQTFASVTDFRFNHILLPRSTSLFHNHRNRLHRPTQTGPGPQFFTYRYPQGRQLPRDTPFCWEGGWEHGPLPGEVCGAPGDATALAAGRQYGVRASEVGGANGQSTIPRDSRDGESFVSSDQLYRQV